MFYKNALYLFIGIIIGIRLTDFWDQLKIQNSNYINASAKNQTKDKSENSTNEAEGQLHAYLHNNTRVLCWILTSPENHRKRALHVKRTWGRRCNKLLFMSTTEDALLETVPLAVHEGRQYLWHKTREAFKYVYDYHFDDADWFLKADDDTYVVMENLRLLLYQFSSSAPLYFGCKFHPFVAQGYMSGGAGYVLSKEALRRFAVQAYPNTSLCSRNQLSEDKEMGICLQNVGVVAGDARDAQGLERFMPLAPKHVMPFIYSDWYASFLYYRHAENEKCCSRQAISFHYIKPSDFYIFDYLLYNLRPFGVHSTMESLPNKLDTFALVKKWRNELPQNIYFNFNRQSEAETTVSNQSIP